MTTKKPEEYSTNIFTVRTREYFEKNPEAKARHIKNVGKYNQNRYNSDNEEERIKYRLIRSANNKKYYANRKLRLLQEAILPP